jgi:acetoin utilization deacetylase AcuC-like enzyme
MPAPIPVLFAPEMVAEAKASPSAGKPPLVVERWRARGLPIEVRRPEPVSEADLCRAHDPEFVRGVLELRIRNGFWTTDARVASSLLWTNGAMLSAARAALDSGTVACAPCSGFHHARRAAAAGFCTFNGLVVAALALRAEGRVSRVGILDADMHWGDGTDELLDALGARGWIQHVTFGKDHGQPAQAPGFLAALPDVVRSFAGCDVVLYQAGADPHVDDPLGGWLTTEELARRDALVFRTARAAGLPVAWNLAGGYQRDAQGGIEPVLLIHENTMRACAAAWDHPT